MFKQQQNLINFHSISISSQRGEFKYQRVAKHATWNQSLPQTWICCDIFRRIVNGREKWRRRKRKKKRNPRDSSKKFDFSSSPSFFSIFISSMLQWLRKFYDYMKFCAIVHIHHLIHFWSPNSVLLLSQINEILCADLMFYVVCSCSMEQIRKHFGRSFSPCGNWRWLNDDIVERANNLPWSNSHFNIK